MSTKTKPAVDIRTEWNRAFDHAVDTCGVAHDAPTFRAALAENLAGAAWTWWYRAVDVAPVLIGMERGLVCSSIESTNARKMAIDMIAQAYELLANRARDARGSAEATHWRIHEKASPLLVLAKSLLMAAI